MSETPQKDLKKIAIVSTSAGGGAGGAAYRLAEAINEDGALQADFIDVDRLGERLPNSIAPDQSFSNHCLSNTHYSVEHPGFVRGWLVSLLNEYDLVNIHWSATLIGISEIDALSRTGQPILFTLHDFYYLTGGCHYMAGCTGVATGCHACPQIDGLSCSLSLPSENLAVKQGFLARPNVHVAAPSVYLASRAASSGLVSEDRAHCLRNPYLPVRDYNSARVGDEVRIVLIADSFGEWRKNIATAVQTLEHLVGVNPGLNFVIDLVGGELGGYADRVDALPFRTVQHGHLKVHEEIAKVFADADMVLSCSLDDNWPNVLVEGGAYGCAPIVGPGHGCEEFVRTYGFGAVAEAYTPQSFTKAILGEAARMTQSYGSSFEESYVQNRDRAVREIRDDHRPEAVLGRLHEIWGSIG